MFKLIFWFVNGILEIEKWEMIKIIYKKNILIRKKKIGILIVNSMIFGKGGCIFIFK